MEERKQELRKLYSLLVQLKSEIQYMCNTLPDCFSKLAKQTKSPFCDWLMELAERMEKKEDVLFQEIWKEELQYLYEISSLQWADIEPLEELADKLGTADTIAQLKAIDYALLHIEKNRSVFETEINQKKKVILTLSFFFGFMTLILLL